jgi:D-alanyl-lipoteichoic acid acyltransferase DltB (MBOAT superfamily)
MLFNSAQFAIFFAAVLGVFRATPPRLRSPLLLGASLLFYTLWYPAYTLLLAAELIVNYALLRGIASSRRPGPFLAASVVFTLGLLAGFKYAGLIVETALPLLRVAAGWAPPIPELFLPLGISFYSFQIIGLAVDTYRRQIEAPRSFWRYALFVSFFPQLIAGPIMRGYQLLPQLEEGGGVTPERTRRGLWLIASGVAKKVVIADFLLVGFVDQVFENPGAASGVVAWIATYSFAFQIYYDFSGYTDIARGCALLLGYELPLNFMEPYLSRNPAEFWRRWHITLSRWLRDYLYIPLGGNRVAPRRVLANLLITMLLGGLWHGAAWTFLIWGGLHGLLLIGHRLLTRRARDESAPLSWRDAPRILLLFHAVCLLWIFFRASSLGDAGVILGRLLGGSYAWESWPLLQMGIVVLCGGLQLAERWARAHLPELRRSLEGSSWGAALEGATLGLIAALAVATAGAGGEFIYFQF